MNKYKEYFDIDPEYFPAVNSDVIKKDPDLWKKFYPHETFVKLLRDVVNVLNHTTNRNVWVEGAYGTGKSHAVITLKKLLDASEAETEAYFDEYPSLGTDLRNKFIGAKKGGRILTVHRYGSSAINGDNDLFIAIQDSIEAALADAGIANKGEDALSKAVVKYLSDPEAKAAFEIYVKGSYADLFGCDVDTIIKHLQEYEGAALLELMRKVLRVASEKQIKAFTLDAQAICEWIHSVIEKNNLAHLIFIWDEFTEYLLNNPSRLTGFQQLLEKSQTENFCFIPVTHESGSLLDTNSRNKIMGRFITPTCKIELPENTAFQLMGAALKKNADLEVEWSEIIEDLEFRTQDTRGIIKREAKINDSELKGILPIQPYTAYVLKNISSSFNSNQRSMFDFIKNNTESSNIEAFQWFIGNVGPDSVNPLLTVDLLWSFFYDSDRDALAPNIRMVMDNYYRLSNNLDHTEKRILKAVLLMQALSIKTNNNVMLLLPTARNLNYAFEGSDMENGEASRLADKLVRDHVLMKRKIGRDTEIYSVMTQELDSSQLDEKRKIFKSKRTIDLIELAQMQDAFSLNGELRLRVKMSYATVTNFEVEVNKAKSNAESDVRHIYAIATFAMNPSEAASMSQKIRDMYARNPTTNIIFVDCSRTQLTNEAFDEWVDHQAQSAYYISKDKNMSQTYMTYANQILSTWRANIGKGQMVICDAKNPNGSILANIDSLIGELHQICLKRYRLGLEHLQCTSTMWDKNYLKMGVECGVNEKTRNAFSSANTNTKLEIALKDAWGVPEYWKKSPSLLISQIKNDLTLLIETRLQEDGRISIGTIYDSLKKLPVAILPCNLTAFVLGFLLKEYVNGKYSWSDSTTRDELTLEKMQEMIEEVIKNDMTPNPRYRDKYIVTMSKEEKAFIELTSVAFHLPKTACSTTEQARESVRSRMKGLVFPIWTLLNILSDEHLVTDSETIGQVIKLYCDLANNNDSTRSDSDIAIAIGNVAIRHQALANDLEQIFTHDKCRQGMQRYLKTFDDGELVMLADSIDDGGQYINVIRGKFDADAAAWVWKKNTVDEKIREVILEYKVINASNQYVGRSKSLVETFENWISKCRIIRLPYPALKNEVGDLDRLLSLLLELAQVHRLNSDKLPLFLQYIEQYGDSFISFIDSQKNLFKKLYALELNGLNDGDLDAVFNKLPFDGFKLDKVTFATQLSSIIEEYKKHLGAVKLRKLWLDMTGTETPKKWSQKYNMPIFIMVPDQMLSTYRRVFNTINYPTDANSVEYAISQLEKAPFINALNDVSDRDSAFRSAFIGSLSTMLADIDEVKEYLAGHVSIEPYNWGDAMTTIKNLLLKLAERKYNQGGYEAAFSKIDSMTAEDVKSYLKDMIKNNMNVGIEIINS